MLEHSTAGSRYIAMTFVTVTAAKLLCDQTVTGPLWTAKGPCPILSP